MRIFKTRNSENKVVSVLPPVKFGVEVQGSSYLTFVALLLRMDAVDSVRRISDSVQWLKVLIQKKKTLKACKSFNIPAYFHKKLHIDKKIK